ncbi:MAG: hypothetical protein LBN42_01700 [Oscillospiraceae bacterium]|nr:hypothetical protein [Oscillospiraceae bacterium]
MNRKTKTGIISILAATMLLSACGTKDVDNGNGSGDFTGTLNPDLSSGISAETSDNAATEQQDAGDGTAKSVTTTVTTAEPTTANPDALTAKQAEYLAGAAFFGSGGIKAMTTISGITTGQAYWTNVETVSNYPNTKLKGADGVSRSIVDSLKNAAPTTAAVFWFNHDDLTAPTKDEYAANYISLLTKARNALGENVEIIVLSQTPAVNSAHSKQLTDEFNDFLFNAAETSGIEDVHYVSMDAVLKNSSGFLKAEFNAWDGVKLTEAGYKAVVLALARERAS